MNDRRGSRRFVKPSNRTARVAAVAAATVFAGVAFFEVALALGAPLGHAAWGGAHAHLSMGQRIGSGAAVVVWAAAALIVLGRAGLWSFGRRERLFHRGTWVLVGVSTVAALMNSASGSRWENVIFAPTAALLTGLCLVVATSVSSGQARATQHVDESAIGTRAAPRVP
jgi:hypothetical protein